MSHRLIFLIKFDDKLISKFKKNIKNYIIKQMYNNTYAASVSIYNYHYIIVQLLLKK